MVGAVSRRKPVFVEDARFLRQQTSKTIKWALPGPMTISDTIADAHYGDRVKMAFAFARLINQEARALQTDGIDMIQIDEPAFNVYMDDVKNWGVEALDAALDYQLALADVERAMGVAIK